MNKNSLILCLFALLFFSHSFSQYNPAFQLMSDVNALQARQFTGKMSYKEIEGTPYYNSDFVKGTIYLNDGNYAQLLIRFDLFQDEMEFKKDEKILWLMKKDIKSIAYGNEKIWVMPNFDDGSKLSYYFVSDSGKNMLYVKKKVAFYEMVPPKGYADAIPDRFDRDKDEFYIQLEGSSPQKIKTRKALLAMLSGNNAALDFMKKEKMRADNFEDLKKLIAFLNKQ